MKFANAKTCQLTVVAVAAVVTGCLSICSPAMSADEQHQTAATISQYDVAVRNTDPLIELQEARQANIALRNKGGYVTPNNINWPAAWNGLLEGYFPSERWSSKAAAEEFEAHTQINLEIPDASPKWQERPYLPVNGKGGEDISGPYVPLVWPKPYLGSKPSDWGFGGESGVYAESPDRVFVLQRDEQPPITRPLIKEGYVWGPDAVMEYVKDPVMVGTRRTDHILIFNHAGHLVDAWKQWNYLFNGANQYNDPSIIAVDPYDPERHIWVVCDESLLEFTHDGKQLVRTIKNTDPYGRRIGMHGGIAWLPNGDFFLLGVDRVVKFSKDGRYLLSFGQHGSGPGDFGALIHGVAVDPVTHRVYIGDRLNSRIEVFDENGKFLDQWPNIIGPYSLRLSKDRHLWVMDTATSKFLKYDLNGRLILSWGTFGIVRGALWSVHYFDVDSSGALYIVSDYAGREGAIQKWVRRKDVSPNDPRLIGQLYR